MSRSSRRSQAEGSVCQMSEAEKDRVAHMVLELVRRIEVRARHQSCPHCGQSTAPHSAKSEWGVVA